MKLYMSANSPYARIVRVVAREIGPLGIDEIALNPRDAATGFWDRNPIAKIPALELDDGTVLPESDLICRHLDARFAAGRLHARIDADPRLLALHGIVRGMLDRGVAARTDILRPAGPDRQPYLDAQFAAIARACDLLDKAAPRVAAVPDLLDIALGCTVEWLDFRHPHLGVQAGRPGLAAWAGAIGGRPAMVTTRPA